MQYLEKYKDYLLEMLKDMDGLRSLTRWLRGEICPVLENEVCIEAYDNLGLSKKETKKVLQMLLQEGRVEYLTDVDVRPVYEEDQE